MKKYQDFGNKIGGAKKDLWAAGMQVSHIDGMSEKEMKKFVNKNAVFPKPDYENMDQEPLVIYWKKLVRDTIPPSPKKWDEGGVKDYVSVVQHIACIVNSVNVPEDIEALKDDLEEMANLGKEIINAFPIRTSREETVRRNLYYLIKYPNLKKIDEDRVKKGFMCTLEEKMRATYAFDKLLISKEDRPIATKGGQYRYILKTGTVRLSFWRNEILKPETYCIFVSVGSEIDILGYNIASEKEADEAINTFIAAKVLAAETQSKGTSNRKKRLVPEYLDEIKREGKDVIGTHVIDGTTYLKEFKLYGGEYGNWLNQKDRRAVINYGYEAFKDLAMILGIEDKDISLGGKLSIAFGARGSGSALAHYEPLYEVINLTKLRGAGSLAHEWGHALDYILGEKLYGGKLISSHNQMGNGMIKAMKFNPNGTISQFYSEAKKLDSCYAKSDKGYWSSETEMFARCFACYIFDKLKEKGYRNDYLCGHAYLTNGVDINGNIIHGYPIGEDKKRIFSEIDLIINTLKEKELLSKRVEKEVEEENIMENIPFITSFQQLTLQF